MLRSTLLSLWQKILLLLENSFFILLPIVEAHVIPDVLLKLGVHFLMGSKKRELEQGGIEAQAERRREFIKELNNMPIAINTKDANEQHYEVPTEYYDLVLGERKKYSCCIWDENTKTLEQAENNALKQVAERAQVSNGQRVLDLGCGWGSVTLYLAEHFPGAQITSVSNSRTQKMYIDSVCQAKGFKNVNVITCDINSFNTEQKFDRVISVEMFEHMKNYRQLLKKISSWMNPGGFLFVHHFSHVLHPYHFDNGEDYEKGFNWMARTFFTGGTMPSDDLLLNFQDDLRAVDHWAVNGVHYQKTLLAWLERQDKHEQKVKVLFRKCYGPGNETRWIVNWRLFYLACAGCFGYNGGNEWFVTHLLFQRPVEA